MPNYEMQHVEPAQEPQGAGAPIEVASARAIQQVQGAIIMARRFPRDEAAAIAGIRNACRRRSLAENSHYEYVRGGQLIRGANINLMEEIARHWGHLDYGVNELDRDDDGVTMEAFAWDCQSNVRRSITFRVPNVRVTKKGRYELTDPRDIYENAMNAGSRRLRKCLESVIPDDIVEMAKNECDKTLASGHEKPRADRIRDMLVAFRSDFGVTQNDIERFLGHKAESASETELVRLRRMYASLKDGVAQPHELFPPDIEPEEARERLEALKAEHAKAAKANEADTPQQGELLGGDKGKKSEGGNRG